MAFENEGFAAEKIDTPQAVICMTRVLLARKARMRRDQVDSVLPALALPCLCRSQRRTQDKVAVQFAGSPSSDYAS